MRGTRRGKRRTEKEPPPPATIQRPERLRPIRDIKRTCRTGIPGYDPWRDRGPCTFDAATARNAIRFFERELSHVKGELARKPFLLERWQRAIIGNLFGWKRPDGTRRYRYVFLFVPRKNGKTPMAAGIILYCLFEDGEPGAEIYGAASEYKQASLVFEHAAGMVRQNPDLAACCTTYKGQARAIQLNEDFSTYRVIASDAGTAHGFNTHAYVVDELHTLPDSELIDTLETSTGARRQPLGVYITTSDYEREGSPCNAKYDYAVKVRDGIIKDSGFLPVIYEASRDDDWTDLEVWRAANPNLGVSLSREYLAAACRKAQDTPTFENTFKRLHLNIRTEQAMRWLQMEQWDACAGDPVDLEDYRERACWAGLDLGATRDLTAFVMCFAEPDGTLTLVPVFWIPRGTAITREKRDRVPYLTWINQGWIRGTDGDTMDQAVVRRDINLLHEDYGIEFNVIAVDRLFQGDQLAQELKEKDGFEVQAHGQGFLSMAAPTLRFGECVKSKRLHHGGNPVLRWHASNAAVKPDEAGNIKPDRKRSTEKIDGIVAAIMAVGQSAGDKTKPVYGLEDFAAFDPETGAITSFQA